MSWLYTSGICCSVAPKAISHYQKLTYSHLFEAPKEYLTNCFLSKRQKVFTVYENVILTFHLCRFT